MFKRLLKTGSFAALFGMGCLIVVLTVSATPTDDNYLLRVEVKSDNENVNVSAPLAMIETLFKLMPKDVDRLCKETDLTAEKLLQEITTLEGQDLVRIEGKENVRVWFEPVTESNRADLGFIKVQVKEGGEGGENINICVPRGLVQIAADAIKQLGLVDKYVKLPPEITQLSVASAPNQE